MAEPARQLALQQAYAAVSAEQLNISTKESGKIASEAGKAYAQWLGELTKGADAAQQQAAALALEERAAGMTVLGYRSLAQAIQEVEIARLKEKQTAMLGDPAAVAEIEREIQARRELIRLVGAKEARKSADDAAKEWQRGADRIEDTITDALMRGFESGKDFAQTLRDTVVNMFKTLVLRPIVSAVVNPVAQAITGSLGFGNAASAAGSAAGGASSLGTLGSLAGIAGSLGTFGSAAGFGASALFGGTGLTALSGGASMIGAGSVAGGLGLMAGVLGPIALGLLAVTALMKDKNATLGYAGGSFSGGGAYSAAGGRLLEFGKGTSQASSELQKVTDSFSATLATTAKSFGGSVADLQVFIGSDVDRKGRAAGSIQFLRDGQRLGGVQTGGTDPRSSAAAKIAAGELGDFFRDSASAALIAGLQQSNIEQRFADYFKGVAAYSLTEEQANAMLASAASAKALGESFGYLGGAFAKLQQISVPAAEALLQAFGGLEGFTSAAGAYYQAFYSDAERSAIATKQLTDSLGKLGQAMPATRDEFRRLVDAQDITTDSGQRMYSALLQLAPAFAAITDASGNIIASTAATEQAAALETRLLQLQGNTAELRRRELAALEPANRALQQRIYALQDAQTAAADAAQLGEAWASVGDTIADEVARIRGLSNEQVRNLAQVQADFAVTTAQARAGDQSAADRLPAISRELLDLASAGARSAQDLAVTRSTVAGSLAQTAEIARAMGSAYTAASKPQSAPGVLGDALGVLGEGIEKAIGKIADKFRAFFTAGDQPGFGEVGSFASGGYHRGGLRIVGENGPELEATGPARIFSADQTARLLSGNADQRALLAALQSLQAEVEGLRFEARATAGHTARLSRLHQDWDGRGLTVKTDADTPLATVTA